MDPDKHLVKLGFKLDWSIMVMDQITTEQMWTDVQARLSFWTNG